MGKKLVKVMAVLQMLLAIVTYFSMVYHFDNDEKIYALLANTDFIATILRLSLYIVPGIHLLSSLYGLVFFDKKILITIAIIEAISCGLTFTFISKSEYMLVLSIISSIIAFLYLTGTLIYKNEK